MQIVLQQHQQHPKHRYCKKWSFTKYWVVLVW